MNTLPDLYPGQLHLLLAERATRRELSSALISRLAASRQLRVLDGGNSFQAHRIARSLRRHTHRLADALSNIHVARAFTCYQVYTLLSDTPAVPIPTLVLEMLDTYCDESVPLHERRRLLQLSLVQLRRLSRNASVLVSAAPVAASQPGELLEMLRQSADQVWSFEPNTPIPPLRLF